MAIFVCTEDDHVPTYEPVALEPSKWIDFLCNCYSANLHVHVRYIFS